MCFRSLLNWQKVLYKTNSDSLHYNFFVLELPLSLRLLLQGIQTYLPILFIGPMVYHQGSW